MMELDGNGVGARASTTASPMTNRSVTAPSKIPQAGSAVRHEMDARALKDLLFSLTQSGSQLSTPRPRPDRVPSEPASRLHSPSPFYQPKSTMRSTSGPTTPVPQNNAVPNPSLYYGNRNLSPLFQAAKSDSVKRTSNLRKEVNPVSPTTKQSEFSVVKPQASSIGSDKGVSSHLNPSAISRNYLETIMRPASLPPGVSSAEHSRKPLGPRTGIRHDQMPSSLSFHHSSRNELPTTHVDGKTPHVYNVTSSSSRNLTYASTNSTEIESMENNLRRLLNLNTLGGNITGVR